MSNAESVHVKVLGEVNDDLQMLYVIVPGIPDDVEIELIAAFPFIIAYLILVTQNVALAALHKNVGTAHSDIAGVIFKGD